MTNVRRLCKYKEKNVAEKIHANDDDNSGNDGSHEEDDLTDL